MWISLDLYLSSARITCYLYPFLSWKLLEALNDIHKFVSNFIFVWWWSQTTLRWSFSRLSCITFNNLLFWDVWYLLFLSLRKKKFCFQEDVKSPQRQSDFEIRLRFSWCYGFWHCFCLEMPCISFVKTKFRVYLLSFWPARDVTDDGFRDATDNGFGELANSNCKLRKGKQ